MLDITRDSRKTLKKEKKTKMRKNQKTTINNFFFYFYFFILKILYFVRRRIWKNLVYVVTFVLQFFRVAGYWKKSNKTSTPI